MSNNIRNALVLILTVSLVGLAASSAQAQTNRRGAPRSPASFGSQQQFGYMPSNQRRNIYNKPAVSPYLNLLRPDLGGAPNYQTLVRPQMQQNRINRQQGQALRGLQQETTMLDRRAASADDPIRATGHTTLFMSYTDYFNTLSGNRGQ